MNVLKDDVVINICNEHVLSLKQNLYVDLDEFNSIEVKLNKKTYVINKDKLAKLFEEFGDVRHSD